MNTTIENEIVDYLKENDMYFIEEYDDEGFPIDNEAYEFVGDLTKAELCDMTIESMEYIAEVQCKIDIDKACKWLLENIIDYEIHDGKIYSKHIVENFRKFMEGKV